LSARRLPSRKGFGFAEVLVATALLAACAMVAGGLLAKAVQNRAVSEPGVVAVRLAVEKAEELKAVPWKELASEPEGPVPGMEEFRREVRVREAGPLLKSVEVVVRYVAPGGVKEVSLCFERAGGF